MPEGAGVSAKKRTFRTKHLLQIRKINLDLRGLVEYAKEKVFKVTELTEKEKAAGIKREAEKFRFPKMPF